ENKLIFLSIGYSSCYWCHVMERESFANEEVAKLLNKGFVCIKVDREERPDIDQIYMTALTTRGQSGGRPLSMFLPADGMPVRGTKFPMPPFHEYLLQIGARTKSDELVKMITRTLDKMAQGGIYDQLGGGFHRYSTERTWTVPHFEKMLYDNAQLVEVYAHAYGTTRNPLYRRIVEETLAFIDREMTAPAGGFYSALDADSGGEEGLSYVWTTAQI